MNKIFKNISKIFVLLFLALAMTACTSKAPEGPTVSSGDSFPKFDAVDFKGNPVSSDVFKDSPVTIMSIWFTGCKGCIDEMPTLQKISEELKDKNVKVMSICLDTYEDKKIKEEAEKIIEAKGVKYPNLAVFAIISIFVRFADPKTGWDFENDVPLEENKAAAK